ncbi:MAG: phospholipase D family protein [Planctomycetes bacterium]|nr:phospholipase D family protein [Planctomycetota bacterium]
MSPTRWWPAALLLGALALLPFRSGGDAEAQARTPVIDVYFSPKGGTRDRLLKEFNLCKTSIDICVYDISSGLLAGAIKDAKGRGRKIRVITDSRMAGGDGSEVEFLKKNGIEVTVAGGWGKSMHNKFAVFDGGLVVTGSYNWSDGAEEGNRENAIFIKDAETVGKYREEFEKLWAGKK